MPINRSRNKRPCVLLLARAALATCSLGFVESSGFAQAFPCGYEIDLMPGPICGPKEQANTFGACISDQGDIAGWFGCAGGTDLAFVSWNAGAMTPLTGMPAGTYYSRASGISSGVICGTLESTVLGSRFGFRWANGVGSSLGTLIGGNSSEAYAINSQGVIVGAWGDTVNGPYPRAFRWQNGTMVDIGADLLSGRSLAYDVNDVGAITGFMGQTAFPSNAHAFIWDNGQMTDLGLMAGAIGTEGRAINDNNQVVGIAWFTSNNAAGYVRRGFFWQNGVFTDLGMLPGYTEAFPHALNDDGTVVGMLGIAPGQDSIPFVWRAGALKPLMDMVATPSVSVRVPRSINSAGQIATSAIISGDDVAVRLRPVLRDLGDTNCDTFVNINDLLTVINQWGLTGVDGDVNADWTVNINDLLIVINNWG